MVGVYYLGLKFEERQGMIGRKIQFACGGNKLDGWENYDIDVDMRKTLPFEDSCASLIFSEHGLEHLFQREAWNFLRECYRILEPGGIIRICVPSIVKISKTGAPHHLEVLKKFGWGDGSVSSAIAASIFLFGHQSMWTSDLLIAVMEAIGFKAHEEQPDISIHPALNGIENHWKSYGGVAEQDRLASSEHTVAVEGTKA